MYKSLLFGAALAGALVGLAAPSAMAGQYPDQDMTALHRRGVPPVSGIVHVRPGPVAESYGPAIYDVRRGHRLTRRYVEAPWRDRTSWRRRPEVAYETGFAAGHYRPQPGDSSYAIPPAGGLAVYSPGAYGPGPRIITIPSGY